MIAGLKSEVNFLREQLTLKESHFIEEIKFLRKKLDETTNFMMHDETFSPSYIEQINFKHQTQKYKPINISNDDINNTNSSNTIERNSQSKTIKDSVKPGGECITIVDNDQSKTPKPFKQQQRKQNQQSKTPTPSKQQQQNQRSNVIIFGDSMLNGIEGNRMSCSKNKIAVHHLGGGTTTDMLDMTRILAKRNPEVLIMHAGTNDLTNDINTINNLNTITHYMKEKHPNIEFVISQLTKRNDINNIQKKVDDLNDKIKRFCEDKNIHTFKHEQIDESCLGIRQLHLNRKGKAIFSSNFKNFLSTLN